MDQEKHTEATAGSSSKPRPESNGDDTHAIESDNVRWCPSCRAVIENADVAHFDQHAPVPPTEPTQPEPDANGENVNQPRAFNFNPFIERTNSGPQAPKDEATDSE